MIGEEEMDGSVDQLLKLSPFFLSLCSFLPLFSFLLPFFPAYLLSIQCSFCWVLAVSEARGQRAANER